MKLHRDLEINQKSAWHLAHRLRTAFVTGGGMFAGPVEADETYFGGKRKKPMKPTSAASGRTCRKAKRKTLKGRGTVGKAIVAGMKDLATNEVRAQVVPSTDAATLQSFVRDHAEAGAMVYTDEYGAYRGMTGFGHEAINHGVGEYVRGQANVNGIESFWSMLRRAHKGTFHKISPKHLDRYVSEFAGKHNIRDTDTLDQMSAIVRAMTGKQVRYSDRPRLDSAGW